MSDTLVVVEKPPGRVVVRDGGVSQRQLDDETARAEGAEAAEAAAIAAETAARIAADTAEANARAAADTVEANARIAADAANATAIANEVTRAQAAEAELDADLGEETTRATAAEAANAGAINAETVRAEAAEALLASAASVAAETARAEAAEGVNAAAIATETARATAVELVKAGTEDHRLYDIPLAHPLRKFRKRSAHRLTGPCDLAFLGDSLTEGYYAGLDGLTWMYYLARLMQTQSNGNTGGEGFVPSYHPVGGLGQRWALTAGVDKTDNGDGWGRRSVSIPPGESGTLTFTGDRFYAVFTQQPGGGTISVSIDGGTAITASTANATRKSGVMLDCGALTAGNHSAVVTSAGAAVKLDGGFVCSGDNASGYRFWNGGHAGITAQQYATQQGWATALQAMNPAVVSVWLGVNDIQIGRTSAQYGADMATIIGLIQANAPNASIAVVISWPLQGYSDATWQPFADAARAAARAAGAAVIDLWEAVGTPDGGTMWFDTVHLTVEGALAIGEIWLRQLFGNEPVSGLTPPVVITATSSSQTPLTVKAAASPTADIFVVGNSTGTAQLKVNSLGVVVGSSFIPSAATGGYYSASAGSILGYEGGSPNNFIVPKLPTHAGLWVEGAASQSADLTAWLNSTASVYARVNSLGVVQGKSFSPISTGGAFFDFPATSYVLLDNASPANFLQANATTTIVVSVKAKASQTADLTQWLSSANAVLAKVRSDGLVASPGLTDSADSGPYLATTSTAVSWNDRGSSTATLYTILSGTQARANVLTVAIGNAATKGTVTSAAASQSADVEQWQDSTLAVKARVDSAANFTARSFIASGASVSGFYSASLSQWTTIDGTSPHTFHLAQAAANIPLMVRGAASQTGDLQQWQSSTTAVLAKLTAAGTLNATIVQPLSGGYVASPTSIQYTMYEGGSPNNWFTAANAAHVVVRIKAAASQTANLWEAQSSAGVVLARCDSAGRFGAAAGAGTSIAKMAGAIFDHFADAGNTTNAETDLFNDSIAASTLAVNGDKLRAEYCGTITGNANTKRLRVYFGGTLIYDSAATAAAANTQFKVTVIVMRDSSTTVRCYVSSDFGAANAYTALSGLTLTNAQVLKITGTGTSTNDIVGKIAAVQWASAA